MTCQSEKVRWIANTSLWQNLILAFFSHSVSDGFYLVATVGDDNALAVLGLSVSGDSLHSVRLEVLAIESTAHASSITG